MSTLQPRVLILGCGNTLRSDDGVGPWLCEWAHTEFNSREDVRVISRQQWTPDLAEDISLANAVLFIDCSVESAPGEVTLGSVEPASAAEGLATHHQGAPQLLRLADALYGSIPADAQILTIGAGSIELGEEFSKPVLAAIDGACTLIRDYVLSWLERLNGAPAHSA